MEYDWCSVLESKELVIKNKMLLYPLPNGSKTLQLYSNYKSYFDALQLNGIAEDVTISDFLSSKEIQVNYNYFTMANVSTSLIESILLVGAYFEQLPLDIYDIVTIGKDENIKTEKTSPIKEHSDPIAGIENSKEKTQLDDPYFNALRNQTTNTFHNTALFESTGERDAVNYRTVYESLCLIIFSIGIFVAIILYFLNKSKR